MKVAIAQGRPPLLDLAAAITTTIDWVNRAADAGAQLVAFGESFIGGYPVWVDWPGWAEFNSEVNADIYARQVRASIRLESPEMQVLCDACRERSINAVIGATVPSRSGKSLYNAMLTINDGGTLCQVRRKLKPTHGERLCWAPAPDATAAALDAVELGGVPTTTLMCWEHWMPMARAGIRQNGEVIHVAAWPQGSDLYQLASRHYAFEGSCFVLLTALILPPEDVADLGLELPDSFTGLAGGSGIIGPDTHYIVEPLFGREELLVAEIDLDDALRASFQLDTAGHYDRPDVFTDS